MRDSENGINHKCPCCGYEVEFDWRMPDGEQFIKGNESFIKIENPCGRTAAFDTDKPDEYGEYDKVVLLGCPKCGCVSYVVW